MNHNEREFWECFDGELDELTLHQEITASGAADGSGLADTARRLTELHARQRQSPDEQFVNRLESQLVSGLSTPNRSWEQKHVPMDISYRSRPVVMPDITRLRRFRPIVFFEIAAVAALVIAIVAAGFSGWFSSPPNQPTIPAAALQDDEQATPIAGMESAVVPQDGVLWQLPPPEGGLLELSGMTVYDGIIYRLLATPSFKGVEAVDGATGSILWKQSHDWMDLELHADENFVYFERGPAAMGGSGIVVLDADTGEEAWTLPRNDFSMGMTVQNNILFVDDNLNTLKAIQAGVVLWEQRIDPEHYEFRPLEMIYAANVPAVKDDTVVAMSETGVISAFEVSTGDRLWTSDQAYPPETLLKIAGEKLVVLSRRLPDEATVKATAQAAIDSDDSGEEAVADAVAMDTTGTPVAGGSGSSSSSSGGSGGDGEMTPIAASPTVGSAHQWAATGLSLADGSVAWQRNISGRVVELTTINSVVAYLVLHGGMSGEGMPVTPHNSILYGLDANSGNVTWSLTSDDGFFAWLGSWMPAEDWQDLFVVVAYEVGANKISDSSLVFVDPQSKGRTDGVEIALEQVAISVPQGDLNGLYLTLQDGTLIALPPTAVIDGE